MSDDWALLTFKVSFTRSEMLMPADREFGRRLTRKLDDAWKHFLEERARLLAEVKPCPST
jgi:hypothetical protein